MARRRFTIQVDAKVLGEIKEIAKSEDRALWMLVEEALRDYYVARKGGLRPKVMSHFAASVARNAQLFGKLGK